jgi:uncharacterized protein YecT (DUF1311 family)
MKLIRLGLVVFALGMGIALITLKAQTQTDLNEQAADALKKSDDQLNALYKKLMAAEPDQIARDKLKKAQLAWIAFRDADAAYAADANRGGSMEPMVELQAEEAMTKQRIADLQQYLQEMSDK